MRAKGYLGKRGLSIISLGCMAHLDAGQFPSENPLLYLLCSYLETSQSPLSLSPIYKVE